MSDTYQTGLAGEAAAAAFLEGVGYAIIDRRFKTREGEIDLVAAQRGLIVFVEVKARATVDDGAAALEGLARDHARIIAAGNAWCAQNPDHAAQCDFRFDVVLVVDGHVVDHLENVFVG